jgi:hypothetical protein
MKHCLIPPLCFCILLFSSCQNQYRRPATSPNAPQGTKTSSVGITRSNSYQVAKSEYDANFQSRYGLLYLASSEQPFSGRILTIDTGENGEYVQSDEQWRDGRKHGVSAKWFSNGVKMFERNYKDGKWHGTVTRWWPNGQKMYVRGYTNGVRHGKEVTWRSDGTPLQVSSSKIPENVNIISPPPKKTDAAEMDSLPSIDLPGLEEEPSSEPIMVAEPDPEPLLPSIEDPLDGNSQDIGEPGELPSLDEVSSELPVMDEPVFPEIEAADSDPLNDLLPETPELSDESSPNEPMEDDFPGLPELPSPDPVEGALPPLPGDPVPALEEPSELPSSEPALDLPLLPGMEDEGGLPPLPDTDDGLGDLPPLPPLP